MLAVVSRRNEIQCARATGNDLLRARGEDVKEREKKY